LAWQNFQTGSGNAFATATNPTQFDDSLAHLSGFGANQYIEGVVHRAAGYNPTDPHEIELLLRFAITANNARGYEILMDSQGSHQIVRWNGPVGDFTVLPTTGPGTGPIANGNVIRAEMRGSVITVFKNGTPVSQATDTTFPTGNPGIGSFMRGTGNVLSSMGWQSIEAGDLQ